MKKVNVQLVLTNSFLFCIAVCMFIFNERLEANTVDYGVKLTKSIKEIQAVFATKKATDQPSCVSIPSKKLDNGYSYIDPAFDLLINQVKDFFKNPKKKSIQRLFHPRLKTQPGSLLAIAIKQKEILGGPLEISTGDMWGLLTPQNRSQLITCAKVDKSFYSLYGYDIQFVVRIDLLGNKEIGEIYFHLVPKNNRLLIGSFVVIKKTHAEKTYINWYNDAVELYHKGNKLMSFLKMDIARKMLGVGSKVFAYNDLKKITEVQNKIMTPSKWVEGISEFLKEHNPVKIASLFTTKGTGILVRLEVKKELSSQQLRNKCRYVLSKIKKSSWGGDIDGISCGLIIKGENPDKDGRLGSRFFR